MVVIPKASVVGLGRGTATITYDPVFDHEVAAEARRGDVHVTLSKPQRPKRTGEGTRLNLVHLWFRQIADQLDLDEAVVKEAMKRMAVSEGWPTCLNPIDGKEEPIGITWASEDHMALLVKVVELYASLNGLDLSAEG